jgi:hypothetical protein
MFLLDIQKQFERVRFDKNLPCKFILSALSRNKDRTVKVPSYCCEQLHTNLQNAILNLVSVDPNILAEKRHEVFDQENSCFEIFASIIKA